MAIDSFDLEFHAIFDRVSKVVDLKGAYSVAENRTVLLCFRRRTA